METWSHELSPSSLLLRQLRQRSPVDSTFRGNSSDDECYGPPPKEQKAVCHETIKQEQSRLSLSFLLNPESDEEEEMPALESTAPTRNPWISCGKMDISSLIESPADLPPPAVFANRQPQNRTLPVSAKSAFSPVPGRIQHSLNCLQQTITSTLLQEEAKQQIADVLRKEQCEEEEELDHEESEGDDEDSMESDQPMDSKNKKRKRASPSQITLLENIFALDPLPNATMKHQLSQQLGMTPRRITIWFQNKRARMKKLGGKEKPQKDPFTFHHLGLRQDGVLTLSSDGCEPVMLKPTLQRIPKRKKQRIAD